MCTCIVALSDICGVGKVSCLGPRGNVGAIYIWYRNDGLVMLLGTGVMPG